MMLKFAFAILLTSIKWSTGTGCGPGEFDCGNDKCIPETWHCDGEDDCGNFSDEKDCGNCSTSQFRCKSANPPCIPAEFYCNGGEDCSDGSDEIECSTPVSCTGFICDNYECIAASQHCDGNKDCIDGSDEDFCFQEEQSGSLFVSAGSSVFYISTKMERNESVTELPLPFAGVQITGIAYDSKFQYMFIADANKPAIYAVNLTSSHVQELESNLKSPEDLSFDWKSSNLYWIDRDEGTAEAMNVNLLRRVSVLRGLVTPVALAILPTQGYMFIATLGCQDSVSMYDMDGKNRRVLHSVQGQPVSLALHPSKSILYWADFTSGTISYVNYTSNSTAKIMPEPSNVTSVTASEKYIYWTNRNGELNLMKGNTIKLLQLPGKRNISVVHKVTYSPMTTELSECLDANGGCSYVCLTSPLGRTCACSYGMILSSDNKTCVENVTTIRETMPCFSYQFHCKSDYIECIPQKWQCDGDDDCFGGSDEIVCSESEAKLCNNSEFLCSSGSCIQQHLVCDGKKDCTDGSDEGPYCVCDEFFCFATNLCLPWSKVCDGKEDCLYTSDEGGLCSTSCVNGKGNCSDICQKTPQGSKCFCNEGFRLLDDKKTCEDINECHEFGACSHACSNRKGSYKCSCADGYRLKDDKRSCTAEGESATLMYILEDVIHGIDLETHSSKFHFIVKGANMRGFDYDMAEEVFYWTGLNDESIDSYSTRTSSHDVIYRSCFRPVVVRYDWLAKNVYFLDEKSNIGVCTRNGKICKTLIKYRGRRIDSMAISPPSGYMFWTIWASSFLRIPSGVIRRAEMDGSDDRSIVLSEVLSPTAITVDPVLELVYWADMKLKTFECAAFNGFKRRQILQSGVHHPVASVVFEDHIYWIEWGISTIMRCHKFIEGRCENVTDGNVKAHDILVAHKVMQLERNASLCLYENGGCSHLCLSARNRRTCACSDSMTIDVNKTTCLARKCDKNEFKCEDGLCIPEDLRCDGRKQCNDGSDEKNCGTCEELGMHRCKDGTCVKNYQICDGKEDCSDKEDELNCDQVVQLRIE